MDELKALLDEIFEIENIDQNYFKEMKISSDKVIYLIFHERQKIINDKLTSGSIWPIGFILKMGNEYYYCPLNDDEFDENIVKEFVEKIKKNSKKRIGMLKHSINNCT